MNYVQIEIDDYIVEVFSPEFDVKADLNEARHRGKPLVGAYSVLEHPPHTNPGEHHLQVYLKNNKIFAINRSGSGHDGSSGRRIPNKVADALRDRYPKYRIPDNNIIENEGMYLAPLLVEIKMNLPDKKTE